MLRSLGRLSAVALLSGVWSLTGTAQAAHVSRVPAPAARARTALAVNDSVGAVRAVEAFRAALANGDSAAVLTLLSPDAVVIESGDVEHLDDYRRHHLPADIAFARAVHGVHALSSALARDNMAWVASTSVTRGQFDGRAVNSAGAELIVLTRANAASPWRIRVIHWSSHRRAS